MRFKLPVIFAVIGLGLPLAPATAHADEPYCREYTKNVKVGGKLQESYGTACMKPDGSWEVQNSEPAYTQPSRVVTAPTIIREEMVTYVPYYRPAYRPNYTVITFGDRGRDRYYGHGHKHYHGCEHGYKRPYYSGNGYSHHYSNGYSFNFEF